MSRPTLETLADALFRLSGYGWVTAFACDIDFAPDAIGMYRGEVYLRLEFAPEQGLLRLRRTVGNEEMGEAPASGVVDSAVANATSLKGSAWAGQSTLAMLAGHTSPPPLGPNRIFTLHYDAAQGGFRAYSGGLVAWMKPALRWPEKPVPVEEARRALLAQVARLHLLMDYDLAYPVLVRPHEQGATIVTYQERPETVQVEAALRRHHELTDLLRAAPVESVSSEALLAELVALRRTLLQRGNDCLNTTLYMREARLRSRIDAWQAAHP